MTPEERVRGAIARTKVDLLPVVFGFSNEDTKRLHAANLGMSFEDFSHYVGDNDILGLNLMDDIQCYLSNAELRRFAFENGFAALQGDENVAFDRWGVGWELSGGHGQRPLVHPLETRDQVGAFEPPDEGPAGMFHQVERDLGRLRRQGLAVFINQYYCLFEKAWVLLGYENFWVMCHDHRRCVEELLDRITDHRVKLARRIVEYDVTCGHTGDDFGLQTGPAMSLGLWRELFKPRLARIWDVYKRRGLPVLHHSCGDCRLFLEDMIEIGLDVLHPVQASAMPIAELANRYGSRLTFYGGIDCVGVVKKGTPRDVEENVRRTVQTLGQHGGLILGALNIMPDVPADNMRALIESMHHYRIVGGCNGTGL